MVEYAYDAWGRPMGVTGSMAATLGADNPFRYRGYFYDTETKLYYLNQRYYNPNWGRFINADIVIQAGRPLGHNIFVYCSNNPVNYSDPSGAIFDTILDALFCLVDVVAVVIDPSPVNYAALAADVACLAIPVATGGGVAVRVASKADDVIKITKAVDFTDEALDTIKTLDKVGDATKSTAAAGRSIHKGYKAGYKAIAGMYKEFPIKYGRIDFLDDINKIIYELKPNNAVVLEKE